MTATHPLAAAVLQQEAGEPVGVATRCGISDGFTMACFKDSAVPEGTKLYATPQVSPPQARVPLTAEQIWKLYEESHVPSQRPVQGVDRMGDEVTLWEDTAHFAPLHFARRIERAHGIGPETKE